MKRSLSQTNVIEVVLPADQVEVRVITAEGKEWRVFQNVLQMNETLKQLIEDAGVENPIPLPNITGPIFADLIAYCSYHAANPAVVDEEKDVLPFEKEMCPFDAEFIKVPNETIFARIKAANYLDNQPLLELCCRALALQMKGKTSAQVRAHFNIKNDYTPEEEEKIMAENTWLREKMNAVQ
jgi:S-phase kinase-associated protein 1